jgi:hypothetical protein
MARLFIIVLFGAFEGPTVRCSVCAIVSVPQCREARTAHSTVNLLRILFTKRVFAVHGLRFVVVLPTNLLRLK